MRINKKITCYFALAVALLLLLITFALPPLIKHLAVKKIDEATGRKSQISSISLNPFTLTAGISGLRLSEKGSSAPFMSLSSARLSLSPLSLPKRSFIISELQLASPYLHLVRKAPNSFNFSDLISGKKDPNKKGSTPLFSVNNITVNNGSIDFEDQAVSAQKRHSVRELNISVPFVSNMPYLADRYVSPRLSAVVNGSPFSFNGRLKPLSRAVEASISVHVKKLDLPFYLAYLPFPLPVKVDSGRLSTALELFYRINEKSEPQAGLSGNMSLERLAVKEPGGLPLAALERAQLKIRGYEFFARTMDISALELAGTELFVARDRSGAWNFQKLSKGPGRSEPSPAPAPRQKPFELKLAKLSFSQGKLHLSDALPKGGFKTDLQEIELTADNFSLAPGVMAPFALDFRSSRGETLLLKGELAAKPLAVKASLAINGIPLKDYYPYLYGVLTAPVSGTLAVASEILFDQERGLVIEKSALKAKELAAPFGGGDGFRLKDVQVTGISADLKKKKAAVAKVELNGGSFTFSSDKDGTLSLHRLLRSASEPAGPKAQAAAGKKKKGAGKKAPPFSYRVGKVAGRGLGVSFTDGTKEEAPVFTLNRAAFSLAGISGPSQGPIPFTLASGYSKKGRIQSAGTVTPKPFKLKADLALQGIPLRDVDAYLPEGTKIFIADGALSTKLALNLEKSPSGMRGSYAGSVGVRSFYCLDTILDEDLLKWDSLQVDRVKGTLGPFTLAIRDVALSNFYARVIVQKDGTLNVQHLTADKPQDPKGTAAPKAAALQPTPPPGKPAVTASAAAPGDSQRQAISIDAVTMQGGTLAFSDLHLEAPFDTTFYNLGGRVSGLSSQSSRMADVDLRGNLENHSPLAITGVINPLRGDLFLDLKIAFNDIDLSPFTPYSNSYLGYNVDKGKLSLDLSYKIENKTLSSQNKVFIDQFTFGSAVKSEKATKLPVRLAVALLKDRKGEIRLDLPVSGRTDDPKFSVWKLVGQMLQNLLVKVATSPLSLLGSGSGADFSAVYFASGSEQIPQAEQEKLRKLSQSLQDRPDLNLEISGFVDRERDAEGYRNELLLKKMKAEKFRKLVKEGKSREGQSLEETAILPEEYPLYLKAVYRKEKFPKPRNAFGMTKDLPEPEMKKLLLTHTVVGSHELQALARARAEAVKAFLSREGKIPAERLFERSGDIYKPAARKEAGGSRVEFGANVK